MCWVIKLLVSQFLTNRTEKFFMSKQVQNSYNIRMGIDESMYPRLCNILKCVSARDRAEKIRQLASLGEMIESGQINILGDFILSKLNYSTKELMPTPVVENESDEQYINRKVPISDNDTSILSMSD